MKGDQSEHLSRRVKKTREKGRQAGRQARFSGTAGSCTCLQACQPCCCTGFTGATAERRRLVLQAEQEQGNSTSSASMPAGAPSVYSGPSSECKARQHTPMQAHCPNCSNITTPDQTRLLLSPLRLPHSRSWQPAHKRGGDGVLVSKRVSGPRATQEAHRHGSSRHCYKSTAPHRPIVLVETESLLSPASCPLFGCPAHYSGRA